jgi:hypothetical protein
MAWINLMTARYSNVSSVRKFMLEPKPLAQPSLLLPLGQCAIELGDQDALRKITEVARPHYENILANFVTQRQLSELGGAGTLIGETCLYHMAGEDQFDVWERILSIGKPEDPLARALLALLKSLLESDDPDALAEPKGPRKLRYPRAERALLEALQKLSTADLLDLMNSPDNDWSGAWYQFFVLPLAVKRARELGSAPIVPASMGAWPGRRGELLYGRTRQRPGRGTVVRHDDPKTWYGFDAVERKDEKLLVFHYIGLTWKAPLMFDAKSNAFLFLESLEEDWSEVRTAVSPDVWTWIERERQAGRCTHVVAYEPERVSVPEGAVEAAGTHYGVALVAKSLFDV